jgi:5-formyltetrahydrofolate cyclo-ligase
MSVVVEGKRAWRHELRSARRDAWGGMRRGAQGRIAPGTAPDGIADLSDAPGLRAILPNAGEAVAAFVALPHEPPTESLLALFSGLGLRVLVPAPGRIFGDQPWVEIGPVTCALPIAGGKTAGQRIAGEVGADQAKAAGAGAGQAKAAGVGADQGTADQTNLGGETAGRDGGRWAGGGRRLGRDGIIGCQLVLVPALAVDRAGTRLGQGGGWYDRALRFAAPGALKLGVCYPHEVLAAGTLPREAHDVPLDGALTAAGVDIFKN